MGRTRSRHGSVGLRVIGAFKLLGALLLFGAGIGVFRLLGRDVGEALEDLAATFHLDPHNHYIDRAISAASGVDAHRLKEIGVGTFLYALLYGAEGTGLVLGKKWGGYLTVVVTGAVDPAGGLRGRPEGERDADHRPRRQPRRSSSTSIWKLVQEHRAERGVRGPAARGLTASRPRLDPEQVPHEEVAAPALAVGAAAGAVAAAGDDEQVEVLVRLDQGVDHLHRRGRVDVVVELADGQQQLAPGACGRSSTFDCSA